MKNEVTYLYDDLPRITASKGGVDGTNNKVHTAFEEGNSIWYFRAFDYVGVDSETGAPRFRNREGKIVNSSELTDEDMTDIGSAIPKFTYGITINLEYKGFDFTAFGTGVAGNKIFNILYRADSPLRNSLRYYMDNAWTPENKGASMPAPSQVATDLNFGGQALLCSTVLTSRSNNSNSATLCPRNSLRKWQSRISASLCLWTISLHSPVIREWILKLQPQAEMVVLAST